MAQTYSREMPGNESAYKYVVCPYRNGQQYMITNWKRVT